MKSSESVEQQKLFAWAEIARMIPEYKGIELMYHIPNEGKRSNYTGGKMKKEGMKNGVSDVCLPLARGIYHGFYIEMKYIIFLFFYFLPITVLRSIYRK